MHLETGTRVAAHFLILMSSLVLVTAAAPPPSGTSVACNCEEKLFRLLTDLVLSLTVAAAATLAFEAAVARGRGSSGGLSINLLVDLAPFELHLPGRNFAGPGTDLKRRLRRPGGPWRAGSAPVDDVDLAAYRHDLAYSQAAGDVGKRAAADRELLEDVEAVMAARLTGEAGGWAWPRGKAGEVGSAAVVWLAMAIKCALED